MKIILIPFDFNAEETAQRLLLKTADTGLLTVCKPEQIDIETSQNGGDRRYCLLTWLDQERQGNRMVDTALRLARQNREMTVIGVWPMPLQGEHQQRVAEATVEKLKAIPQCGTDIVNLNAYIDNHQQTWLLDLLHHIDDEIEARVRRLTALSNPTTGDGCDKTE